MTLAPTPVLETEMLGAVWEYMEPAVWDSRSVPIVTTQKTETQKGQVFEETCIVFEEPLSVLGKAVSKGNEMLCGCEYNPQSLTATTTTVSTMRKMFLQHSKRPREKNAPEFAVATVLHELFFAKMVIHRERDSPNTPTNLKLHR